MKPRFTSLKKKLEMHKLIRLRQRYVLTKSNKLRLRYVATGCVCILAGFFTLVGAPDSTVALRWSQLKPVEIIAVGFEDDQDSSVVAQDDAGPHSFGSSIDETIKSHISGGIRRAAMAIRKTDKPPYREVEIGSGDTLAGVLEEAGVDGKDAYQAVKALSTHYDPRHLKPGQIIGVRFQPGEDDALQFTSLSIKIDPVKEVIVRKDAEDFHSALKEKKLVKRSYASRAEIQTSLYGSAARAGIPSQIIAEVIRVYSWDIDFQRDIRRGDKIEVLYETMETEDGDFARYGNVLYASLHVGGKEIPIYRYEKENGRIDYFEPNGHSIRKTLMATPVDGARISSGFGMRRHPVLGYNKMHKGTDFAAPTGTPIYAAGDGVVEFAGRNGGYGNYIRLRHNSTLKTAYAHMHKFAKGMSKGKRVEQGDVIGYIGSTGRSTGPHLHYEVHVNNKQVNPRSVDLPTGEQLEGKELKRFKEMMNGIRQQYVSLTGELKFAHNENKHNPIN